MQIRKLKPGELLDAYRISLIAFHERTDDLEAKRAACEQETEENWGALTDDGRMMARIINNRYTAWLDGKKIQNGGIGAVSTLPEYRETGAIRAIFEQLLPEAYRNGEVISTLYPFSHAFYRKFGYETVCHHREYRLPPQVLRPYRFTGEVHQYRPGDDPAPYTALYNRFAQGLNLAVCRTDAMMLKPHLEGVDYRDRKFIYLLSEQGRPVSYVSFRDIRHDPMAILSVEDMAWDGREGFRAMLGFLARFTADYGQIRMETPMGVELLSLLHTPGLYDVSNTTKFDYMIRVVNAEALLRTIRKPADCRFVIRVADDLIPENNGSWLVTGEDAVCTSEAPDISMDIRALGQLAVGAVSLDEALLRDDVTLLANDDCLRRVFVRKPIYIAEHF